MHCHRFLPEPISRREMLARAANGFGAVALSVLMAENASGAGQGIANKQKRGLFTSRQPHFEQKVKSVILLYMDGGPSQVDTFDPKPILDKYHGQDPHSILKVEPTQFNDVGKVLKSPWKFRKYGESGIEVSDLFPHVAKCVDDMAIIRSMIAPFPEHTNANYFLHTGHGQQGRPSHGSWLMPAD